METIFHYEMLPTTWFYLSALMIIAIFFRFDRLWSVRNIDLVALILFTPGLLFITQVNEAWGYVWLFGTSLFFLIRMLLDGLMVRRPLLKPNLASNAMGFTCVALFVFMVAGLLLQGSPNSISGTAIRLDQILTLSEIADDLARTQPPPDTETDAAGPDADSPLVLDTSQTLMPIRRTVPGYAPFQSLVAETNLIYAPRSAVASRANMEQSMLKQRQHLLKEQMQLLLRELSSPESPDASGTLTPNSMSTDTVPPDGALTPASPGSPGIESKLPSEEGVTPILPVPSGGKSRDLLPKPVTPLQPVEGDNGYVKYESTAFGAIQVPSGSLPQLGELLGRHDRLYAEKLREMESRNRRIVPIPGQYQFPKQPLWIELLGQTLVAFSAVLLIFCMFWIGKRHFGNIKTGVACATLYLMVPYSSLMTARMDHMLPAALIAWAIVVYRRPLLAGLSLGLASVLVFYPVFLLPLWCSFYWRRGLGRFLGGVIGVILLMGFLLLFSSPELGSFDTQLSRMLGIYSLRLGEGGGFWLQETQAYRIPVIAAFFMLSGSLALWPAQKNLGVLISCSASVMLGVQFWQAYQGGLYMAWYLPLLIMTIFRPNLEHLVAMTTVKESDFWFIRHRVVEE